MKISNHAYTISCVTFAIIDETCCNTIIILIIGQSQYTGKGTLVPWEAMEISTP